MNRRQYRFVVAGTHSGVGKTTVALGLMAALRRRGLCVQPFKVGPDFIDPGHHTAICGRPCRNLDTWMLPPETVRRLFERQAASADVAVVEGVMGLFDGAGLDSPHGSTAEVAQLIGAPVVLVVDGSAVARSIAAVVKGFSLFDETLSLVGVICNRVAGPKHYAHLEAAIRRHTAVVPLGWLPRRPEWVIPERHLGLTTVDDLADCEERARQLAEACETTLAIDRLLDLTATGPMVEAEAAPPAARGPPRRRARPPHAAILVNENPNQEMRE
ncbi:MAG: cobyrinate a,c-diamide synthase, partial [Gemmataceae bacterium]|nr:cobyrinate a,c-diamide synthase [Gemmataceae bacterium]MDW8266187.1 cobyrinate a,c-diamide synthase [Gemmataceae bacterium]